MLTSKAIIKKNKILIIGAPGSGKTTLARSLDSILRLGVYHLDSFFWEPGWEKVAQSKRLQILDSILRNDSWIIEGNYPEMLELQLKFADVVIILEFSRLLCYLRVIRRRFEAIIKPIPNLATGYPDTLDLRFLKSIWEYPAKDLPVIERALEEADNKVIVVRLSTATMVDNFVKSMESYPDLVN